MKTVSAQELKKRLDGGEVAVVDVREPAEYRAQHIGGSQLLPLSQVSRAKLASDNQPIVLVCRSGRRSANALEKLRAEDDSLEMYNLEGGMLAWVEAGYDVIESGHQMISVDRQTQIVIGSITLGGMIAGLFVDSLFFTLPTVMGAGLIFAGLSGWCGMAKLLAKMPWNQ